MCGLVGVVGDVYLQERRAFRQLIEFDAIRGPHSTGVAVVAANQPVKLLKALGRTPKLYAAYPDDFEGDDIIKGNQIRALIGHNRFATVGAKTPENAHPFLHDDVVGAHNGTLTKHHLHRLDGVEKFDVDSEAIFYGINKNGLRKTTDTMHGAWALSWFNTEENRMHWLRNKERPLHWTRTKDQSSIFWASEEWMLEVALGQAGIKHYDIQEFDPDVHFYVEFDKKGNTIRQSTMKYEREEYKGFQMPVANYSGSGMANAFRANFQGHQATPPVKVEAKPVLVDPLKLPAITGPVSAAGLLNDRTSRAERETRALVGKFIQFEITGEREVKNKTSMINRYLLCESYDVDNVFEIHIYSDKNPNHEKWLNSTGTYTGRVRSVQILWNNTHNRWDRYVVIDMRTISDELFLDRTKAEMDELNGVKTATFSPKVEPTTRPVLSIVPKEEKKEDDRLPPSNTTSDATEKKVKSWELQFDANIDYRGYQGKALTFSEFMQNTKQGCAECGQNVWHGEELDLVWTGPRQYICKICDMRHRTETALKRHNQK